jgi:hypothetical protein
LLDSNIEEDNNETRDERTSLEDSLYKSSPETAEVPMIDWFVSYFSHFKYLGTWISYTLRDDYDISMRIANSTKAMGALGNFFDRHGSERPIKIPCVYGDTLQPAIVGL